MKNIFMPQKRTVSSVLNKLIERVNSNIRRLRILEQETGILKTRTNSLEEEGLAHKNQINKSLTEMSDRITKLDDRIANTETTIKDVIEQLKKATTTTKIRELEQLIDIYNPLKSEFVTKDEAKRMIDEMGK
jgi:vacuolar-type H+-ATPase subunit I/STV1